MRETDSRQFIPPVLYQQVCNFAIRETMCHGIGNNGEFDYTVSDCLTVAMLYPKNPSTFRLPENSSVALLYNAFADLQERVNARKATKPHVVHPDVSHP